jgi:hypothetical protein
MEIIHGEGEQCGYGCNSTWYGSFINVLLSTREQSMFSVPSIL